MFRRLRTHFCYIPKYEDLQYTCLTDQFKSMFKDGVCTCVCPSYSVEDWLNVTRQWFEDNPEMKNNCLLWEYYEYTRAWLEGYNMHKDTPQSLEPKTMNLPEIWSNKILTLRNQGKNYTDVLSKDIYNFSEMEDLVEKWLNIVNFLRPALKDCVYYSEIETFEHILKEHLDKYQQTCACDTDTNPVEEKLNIHPTDPEGIEKLGDVVYDDGVNLLKRIADIDFDDTPKVHQGIVNWEEMLKHCQDTLKEHARIKHIENIAQSLKYFRRGLEAKARFISEDTENQLRATANENSKLVQHNHELRMQIERLEHELDSCKEHVAFLQRSTSKSESSAELHKNILGLIRTLTDLLEDK